MATGFGVHEVIVSRPGTARHLGTATDREFEELFWAYRDRLINLMNNPKPSMS